MEIRAGFLEKVALQFHSALLELAPWSLLFSLEAALESHLKIMGHWRVGRDRGRGKRTSQSLPQTLVGLIVLLFPK